MKDSENQPVSGPGHRFALVDRAVHYPVSTIAGVLLLCLFGIIGLNRLPIQLKPTIDRPIISVTTTYVGAAPQEVELQVTVPIEEKLNSVENLRKIISSSEEGRSVITLEFDWGIDKDLAVIDVMRKVNQVSGLPDDADPPVITATSSEEEQPIMYVAVESELDPSFVHEMIDNVIQPRILRVTGVGDARFFGGQEREVRVVLDPEKLSSLGIPVTEVREAILSTNLNIRAGDIEKDADRWIVRTVGEFEDLDSIASTTISFRNGAYVYIRDVARVIMGYKEPDAIVRINGRLVNVLAINKKTGGNTIKVASGAEAAIAELNREIAPWGMNLETVYTDTDYIWDAIRNVLISIAIGSVLAVLALYLFLKSARMVIVIAITIPVSLIGTFALLWGFKRSVNIISLAGLGFASGMVVDNAIVVLENIVRHHEMGKGPFMAAVEGTSEVWGAVLASTLTTLAVFIPVLFVQEESGQLFRDIAYALSFSVGLSLLVAITAIPSFGARMIGRLSGQSQPPEGKDKGSGLPEKKTFSGFAGNFGKRFLQRYTAILAWILDKRSRCGLTVLVVAIVTGLLILLLPPAEYLPTGNRNLILTSMKIPPGLSLDAVDELVKRLSDQFLHMPETGRMFAVSRLGGPIIGIIVKPEYERQIPRIVGKMWGMTSGITQAQVFIFQASIFQSGITGGKFITVEVRGDDIEKLMTYADELEQVVKGITGVITVRSSLELGNPELRVQLDMERLAELGLSSRIVGEAVEVMVDGKKTGVYRAGGREKEVDLTVIGDPSKMKDRDALDGIPIWSDAHKIVPLSSVGKVVNTTGPTQIEHVDLSRSITLSVFITKDMPIKPVIDKINRHLNSNLRKILPPGYNIRQTGTADDLTRTMKALLGAFVVAVLISYLLMASLFESFLYPFVVILVVPIGMAGAIIGILFTGSQLTVITMLGFIILAGTVINNAILIVHQTRNFEAEGLAFLPALKEAARTRVRPIMMTTFTSVLGMAPLAFGQGSGAELYRGLGAAVLFGLGLSSFVILIFTPAVFALIFGKWRQSGDK